MRENVRQTVKLAAQRHDHKGTLILEIAPQVHTDVAECFKHATIETLDIDPQYNPTYVQDLCNINDPSLLGKFEILIATEVLEHVRNPFDACKNIRLILKDGGIAYLTTPLDLAIHSPAPDCWRLCEDGLRELFKDFSKVTVTPLGGNNRHNFPVAYTTIAVK